MEYLLRINHAGFEFTTGGIAENATTGTTVSIGTNGYDNNNRTAAMLLLLPLFVFYRALFVMLPSPSLLLERSIDPAADDDCDNSFTN